LATLEQDVAPRQMTASSTSAARPASNLPLWPLPVSDLRTPYLGSTSGPIRHLLPLPHRWELSAE
jgi:hypothetical protein